MYIGGEIAFVSPVRMMRHAWGAKLVVEQIAAPIPREVTRSITYGPFIVLAPNSVSARRKVSRFIERSSPGFHEEAAAEIAAALRLDPESFEVNFRARAISYDQGRLAAFSAVVRYILWRTIFWRLER